MTSRTDLEGMTREDLYDLATERDLSGRSSMSKGDLIDALAEPEPSEPSEAPRPEPLTVPAGGIDPALVEVRDAQRAADAAAAEALEERPRPTLDPALAKLRDQTRAADASSEHSVTVAPSDA